MRCLCALAGLLAVYPLRLVEHFRPKPGMGEAAARLHLYSTTTPRRR